MSRGREPEAATRVGGSVRAEGVWAGDIWMFVKADIPPSLSPATPSTFDGRRDRRNGWQEFGDFQASLNQPERPNGEYYQWERPRNGESRAFRRQRVRPPPLPMTTGQGEEGSIWNRPSEKWLTRTFWLTTCGGNSRAVRPRARAASCPCSRVRAAASARSTTAISRASCPESSRPPGVLQA